MNKFWDVVGKIIAIIFVIAFALLIINANVNGAEGFLPATIVNILTYVKEIGALALVVVVTFETISKGWIIFRILMIALLAIIIVFLFFPGVYPQLLSIINK